MVVQCGAVRLGKDRTREHALAPMLARALHEQNSTHTHTYLHVRRQGWDVCAYPRVHMWEVVAAHRSQGEVFAQGEVGCRDDMERHTCG